jgi:hypothetical protein
MHAAAGLPREPARGWHSLWGKFATSQACPLKDLAYLGAALSIIRRRKHEQLWAPEQTIVSIYLQPSEAAQRDALLSADSPPASHNERAQPETSQKEIPAKRVIRCEDLGWKWAWVELNYRPHAYQAWYQGPAIATKTIRRRDGQKRKRLGCMTPGTRTVEEPLLARSRSPAPRRMPTPLN